MVVTPTRPSNLLLPQTPTYTQFPPDKVMTSRQTQLRDDLLATRRQFLQKAVRDMVVNCSKAHKHTEILREKRTDSVTTIAHLWGMPVGPSTSQPMRLQHHFDNTQIALIPRFFSLTRATRVSPGAPKGSRLFKLSNAIVCDAGTWWSDFKVIVYAIMIRLKNSFWEVSSRSTDSINWTCWISLRCDCIISMQRMLLHSWEVERPAKYGANTICQ